MEEQIALLSPLVPLLVSSRFSSFLSLPSSMPVGRISYSKLGVNKTCASNLLASNPVCTLDLRHFADTQSDLHLPHLSK